jgi:hypothetical protein
MHVPVLVQFLRVLYWSTRTKREFQRCRGNPEEFERHVSQLHYLPLVLYLFVNLNPNVYQKMRLGLAVHCAHVQS